MAYETGTAANHEDLWNKFKAFITTDADLVGLNQEWEVVWGDDSNSGDGIGDTEYMLRGPGLANTDDIYVSLKRVDDVASDVSTWFVRGHTGVIQSASSFNSHVNTMPFSVKMFTRPAAMNYWFVASGRRFIITVQIGTVYESIYAGFFLPYADPEQYVYPMFIGGSCGNGGPQEATHWNSTRDDHTLWMFPHYDPNATGHNPSAWMLSPQGDWLRVGTNNIAANAYVGPRFFGTGLGLGAALSATVDNSHYGYRDVNMRIGRAYGDEYTMTPLTLTQATPGDQTFGVLDGAYAIAGRSQSVENRVIADDTVHVVFQNAFRTTLESFWAVALGPEDSNSGFAEDSNS